LKYSLINSFFLIIFYYEVH